MAEGTDAVEQVFATEIAPPTRPRDHQGKFIRETANPELMFQERQVEGDPLTGDTRDGGDDPAFSARERELSDGYEVTRPSDQDDQEGAKSRAPARQRPRQPETDDEYDVPDSEPENISAESEPDTAESRPDDAEPEGEGAQRYEVTVDGQTHQVTLNEALNGYIRQATFHQRLAQLNDTSRAIEEDHGRLQQNWNWWHKARKDYEEDVANMLPAEPNWDHEYAVDPHGAYSKRKIFDAIYAKLQASQQARAEREAFEAQERDRRTQKYAVDGFTKFVMDHIKDLPDEPTLERNMKSMRRTAVAAGFNDYEINTVYDPRMLTVLWKASRFDRITAAAPRAVVQGKGKSVPPGAATPTGNARRNGVDDAQRRLAQTGRIDDAAEVFRRLF